MPSVSPGKAAIIGVGLIGRAWALLFARAGWRVALFDAASDTLAAAPGRLRDDAAILQRHGMMPAVDEALNRIETASSLADAVAGVDFVQENAAERLDVKQELFAALDAATPPDAVIASSSSAIVASLFTEALPGRARCLIGHPVNPPHLVPLVEVCGAPWTAPEAVARAKDVYDQIGQVPIVLAKETDGFVLNRLQGVLILEAFRLVRDGVLSPEDLDKTLKDGLGLRWSFMGPFETIDLNAPGGMADYCQRYAPFFTRLGDDPPTAAAMSPESIAAVVGQWPHAPDPERVARLSDWRNERLAALRAHKASAPEAEG